MSFILDALRRSEQARRALGEQPVDVPLDARRPRRTQAVWPWVVGALLVVNLGVLLWLWQSRTPAIPPPVQAAAPAPAPRPASREVRPLAAEVSATQRSMTPDPDGAAPDTAASASAPLPPPLDALPELMARLPGLEMQVHTWSEDPVQRSALVNLRRYTAGQRLSEGPLVVAIVPEGLVLELDGTRFLLPRR